MRHARTSANLSAAGRPGRVHAVPPYRQRNIRESLCGTLPTGGVPGGGERGRWRSTDEPIDCQRCVSRLEKIVDTLMAAGAVELLGSRVIT